MKLTFFSPLWALSLCFHLHCGALLPTLNIGMELSYPPFETIGPEGKPCGVSVELAHALGKYLDRPVVIQNIPFVGLIPALQTGKIDLIISSMTVTEERQKAIDFSEPYLTTGLCLLISSKSDLQSIAQANEKERMMVVKTGTSGEIYAKAHLDKAHIIVMDKEALCVLEVVQGKADAFIYDQFSVLANWQKNLKTTRMQLKPFKLESWAMGIKKGNDVLRSKVDAFIAEFRQSGGFDRLGNTYLAKQKAAFKELGIPFVF